MATSFSMPSLSMLTSWLNFCYLICSGRTSHEFAINLLSNLSSSIRRKCGMLVPSMYTSWPARICGFQRAISSYSFFNISCVADMHYPTAALMSCTLSRSPWFEGRNFMALGLSEPVPHKRQMSPRIVTFSTILYLMVRFLSLCASNCCKRTPVTLQT